MFYDINDNIKTDFRFSIRSEDDKEMSLKVDCINGKTLMCSTPDDLQVFGRHDGDVTWIDLVNDGIDLSPWAGDREIFEIKFEANVITEYNLNDFFLYLA